MNKRLISISCVVVVIAAFLVGIWVESRWQQYPRIPSRIGVYSDSNGDYVFVGDINPLTLQDRTTFMFCKQLDGFWGERDLQYVQPNKISNVRVDTFNFIRVKPDTEVATIRYSTSVPESIPSQISDNIKIKAAIEYERDNRFGYVGYAAITDDNKVILFSIAEEGMNSGIKIKAVRDLMKVKVLGWSRRTGKLKWENVYF